MIFTDAVYTTDEAPFCERHRDAAATRAVMVLDAAEPRLMACCDACADEQVEAGNPEVDLPVAADHVRGQIREAAVAEVMEDPGAASVDKIWK